MLKIKKGDNVIVIAGSHKGKTGKVSYVDAKLQKVTIDGINVHKKHLKPSRQNPQGGIQQVTLPISVSNVAIVHPSKKDKGARVGFKVSNGKKSRVLKQAGNKEIK